jgi:NAD-dependent dihydropyrimidine dehydrogenase PreA subunit/predicted transcriptional regulator
MSVVNDPYQKIAEMWTFPNSDSFHKMLEALLTREDADLLLECTRPVTASELARRLNADEKVLVERLDVLAKRGIVFRGKTQYHFRMGVHFSFAGMPAPGYEPSEEYRQWRKKWADENPDREVKGWISWYQKTGNPVHRVYPARLAILSNPKIKKEDLLWHEDIEQIFRKSELLVAGPCGCRVSGGMGGIKPGTVIDDNVKSVKCDHPMWNCFQFRKDQAEFNLKRGGALKVMTVEQALEKSDEAERAGLIHEGPTNSATMPGVICSCASDCCGMLIVSLASGRIKELYTPSRFQAVSDKQDQCNGCQSCVQRCPFDAIDMVKVPGAKKLKAQIRGADCMGCGVCVVGCEQKALSFELVRPATHIPPHEQRYTGVRGTHLNPVLA